jgi:hypothetical protein
MTTKKQKLGMYVTRINDIKFSWITQLSEIDRKGEIPKMSISVTDFRNETSMQVRECLYEEDT